MRSSLRTPTVLFLLTAGVVACAGDEALLVPESEQAASAAAAEARVTAAYRAHLTGGQEVPAVDTRAQGQAIFRLSGDGTELSYRLIVANIEDVLMSHIHLASPDANGPVVAWLYPDGPPPQLIEGRFSGVLAEGTITAADLVGPLAGVTLADLVSELESGGAYVNVHTLAVPSGEVRGQIR